VAEVAINLYHLPEVITGYLGDGSRFGMRVTYSLENPILGSAGAAKRLEGFLDSTFLVVYGDMLLDVELAPLLQLHRQSGAHLTMGLMPTDDPASKGIAQVDAGGRVLRFVEKPKPGEIEGNLASGGVYLGEPDILTRVPAGCYYDLGSDLVPRLLQEGVPVSGRLLEGYLLDIGTPETFGRAQQEVGRLGRHWAPETME
jgi:NDP-sugar pyrophosphorylase family protein